MKLQALLDKITGGELAIRVQVGKDLSAEITADGGDVARLDAVVVAFGEQKVEVIRLDEAERLEITARRPE